MAVYQFIRMLREMGVPPDTKIHLIPKDIKAQKFHCDDYSFYVNFSGESYLLCDFDKPCYIDCIEGFVLDIITIFGSDLLISYFMEV